ncbi:hypothetical protein [Aquimonas sp.]|uniref:hypothetical protein n=1 Tax=Aquimonas sp. TaxID=1872588 RepID=UPI0037BF2504
MADLHLIPYPRWQKGLSLLEVLFVVAFVAITTGIMIAAVGVFEREGMSKNILRTSAALIEAAQPLRASGNFTLVRTRAGIDPALYVGSNGVAVDDAIVAFAPDRLSVNGAVGVWVEYQAPEVCIDVARQAAQRFGRVFVGSTEVGGLSGLAARGAGSTSNPLQLTDSALDLECRGGAPPRRVRIYEH